MRTVPHRRTGCNVTAPEFAAGFRRRQRRIAAAAVPLGAPAPAGKLGVLAAVAALAVESVPRLSFGPKRLHKYNRRKARAGPVERRDYAGGVRQCLSREAAVGEVKVCLQAADCAVTASASTESHPLTASQVGRPLQG